MLKTAFLAKKGERGVKYMLKLGYGYFLMRRKSIFIVSK